MKKHIKYAGALASVLSKSLNRRIFGGYASDTEADLASTADALSSLCDQLLDSKRSREEITPEVGIAGFFENRLGSDSLDTLFNNRHKPEVRKELLALREEADNHLKVNTLGQRREWVTKLVLHLKRIPGLKLLGNAIEHVASSAKGLHNSASEKLLHNRLVSAHSKASKKGRQV